MFLSDYKSNFHFGYVLKNIDLRYIDKKEIDKLINLLQPLGLASVSRTGVVAMSKGSEVFGEKQ